MFGYAGQAAMIELRFEGIHPPRPASAMYIDRSGGAWRRTIDIMEASSRDKLKSILEWLDGSG